jgi:uncharacterized repeat protein (TIGR03803 family)
MKQINSKAIILSVLLIVCRLINAMGQYTKLTDFDGPVKGSYPAGSLTLSGSVLYGMTNNGGIHSYGVIFKVNTDGSGFTKLIEFDGIEKGSSPWASLTLSGNVLFGTTYSGGANSKGAIFKVNTDGSGFAKLVDFNGAEKGSYPLGSLTLSGNQLYGMTELGGANNDGVIFKVNTDGTAFVKLTDFNGTDNGRNPYGDLILSGTTLYGMTSGGGAYGRGAIFRMDTNGTGFVRLADFDGDGSGSYPPGSLIMAGNTLYGTTGEGGPNHSEGVLFKLDINTKVLEKLVYFDDSIQTGVNPSSSLTLLGNTIYGMTTHGGANHKGVIFKVNTDGTGFSKLLDFDGANGANPLEGFTLSGNVLYGMTDNGGTKDKGVVFQYALSQTGIDDVSAGYRIFPNPVHDQLMIKSDKDIYKIEIINSLGVLIKSISCSANEIAVSTSDLPQGIYILNMYDKAGNVIAHKKLLKQ